MRKAGIKNLVIIFFSLSCLIYLIPDVYGQNRSSITGYVFDSHRQPIIQVPVELMNDVNSVLQRVKTDNSGRFFFRGVTSLSTLM